MPEVYLTDTSAWARSFRDDRVAEALEEYLRPGLVAVCGAVQCELVYTARSQADARAIRAMLAAFQWLPTTDEVWDRVCEVQGALLDAGQHRAVGMADLIIAATAERHGATVLHYDADYDLIAKVTDQPTRWIVPRGSVS
ncbi:MAG TPA: PIN domain nuclease [Cryptosporangiaceae bacterium]|nr:PIN domain nuclease [Cryptosporangiaceae bacterium]